MRKVAVVLLILFGGDLSVLPSAAAAAPDAWPAHAVTLVTPAPPGGAVDGAARLVADTLSARLHQPVLVENKPGADGLLAADAFLAAADVEHTFLVTFGGLLVSNPVTHERLRYDPLRDFVPVAMLATDTIVICANPAFEPASLQQMFAFARDRPASLRWASAPGEPKLRLSGAFARRQLSALFVPYKSTGQAVTDLLAGHIDVMAAPLASVLGSIRAGQLKVLVVMAAQRTDELADVPSASESGAGELAMVPFIGMLARRGVRPIVVERMNAEVNAILRDLEVSSRLLASGLHPTPGTPATLASTIESKLRENRELAASGAGR